MPQQRTFAWLVAWSNPNKPRPPGFPEVMLRLEQVANNGEGARCPREIDECWQEMHPYGYCVQVHLETPPARRLPLESKQRIRRRNLWKRLLKRFPMFCDVWYADAVQARPEHYGPYTPGEFADVQWARGRMGDLRMVKHDAPA